MNTVKVVLGFIELALGFKFLSIADQAYHWGILDREIFIAIWFLLALGLALYLFGLIRGSNETMVFRNEDTGWIYPPYFKFDSSDLQAEAAASISTAEPQQWVVVTHYGWRVRWLSIYPNAVAARPAPSEDYRPFPWVNLIIFAVMIGGLLFLRAMWLQFRERTVDPLADRVGDQMDHVNADLAERKGRISRWLDTWRKKK